MQVNDIKSKMIKSKFIFKTEQYNKILIENKSLKAFYFFNSTEYKLDFQ